MGCFDINGRSSEQPWGREVKGGLRGGNVLKKGLLHLVVVLIFILSGCNGRSVLNEWAVNGDAILSEDVSKAAFVNALARWVESDRLTSAEDTINAASAFTGMRAEFAIEGDDILVINCIYVKQIELNDLAQERLEIYFPDALNGISSTIASIFTTCEEATGVKLQCVRVNYVNADGTMVYTYDFLNTR